MRLPDANIKVEVMLPLLVAEPLLQHHFLVAEIPPPKEGR
jgi:hypothetical protein